MVEFARRLCSEAHYEQSDITTRQRAVLQRRERVKSSAEDRQNKLEDCKKLMVFLQNCMEVRAYYVYMHMYIYMYVAKFVMGVAWISKAAELAARALADRRPSAHSGPTIR